MTFGGELLLFPEVVFAIHKEAIDAGIPSREIITNGYWSKEEIKIKEIAKNLAESGVNKILISVDAFHQEHIPLSIVRNTAKFCLQEGIQDIAWNPCWLISKDDNNQFNKETKHILEELADLTIRVSEGNIVEPDGLALVNLKEYLPLKTEIPIGKCGDMPYTNSLDSLECIYVEPDGRIAICKNLYIGNASNSDIINLIENYNPFTIPQIRIIFENGMKGLIEWASAKGIKLAPEGYHSVCQMCVDIRKRIDRS